MDKERLEEIKDSANLQLVLAKKLNFDKNTIEIISEEIELLDYINDLQQRIDKAVEYNQEIIDNYLKEDDCEYCDGRYSVAKKNINILKGDDTNDN